MGKIFFFRFLRWLLDKEKYWYHKKPKTDTLFAFFILSFFAGFDSHFEDNTTAQLIADSTEKKFNFNPFKGKLFKKKQYSFDFN